MHVETLVVPPLDNNVYLVVDEASHQAAVIDVGLGAREILAKAQELGVKILYVLNTHGHPDHTADDAPLKAATGAKLAIFEVDAYRLARNANEAKWFLPAPPPVVTPDVLLKEGSTVTLGGVTLETLHTPGHTEGSCCFYDEGDGVLFSGDTLFAGSCGRTDTLGGSPAKMKASLRRLAQLPPETKVLPGHGPATTIGAETWIADLAYPVI
ncbi:MAG TPA: MBL fold metallo-hydrolase [Thermoplasmata archaeon]|nr:MBL fold metallo-hydrolase [Thermoplasmata archaeon]